MVAPHWKDSDEESMPSSYIGLRNRRPLLRFKPWNSQCWIAIIWNLNYKLLGNSKEDKIPLNISNKKRPCLLRHIGVNIWKHETKLSLFSDKYFQWKESLSLYGTGFPSTHCGLVTPYDMLNLPDVTKPLPEPILSHQWHSAAITWYQFPRKINLWKREWKFHF